MAAFAPAMTTFPGCANVLGVREGKPEPRICVSTSDCGPGAICRDGLCAATCATSGACALGESCREGACVPDGSGCSDERDRCYGLTPQTCSPDGVWVAKQEEPCERACAEGSCFEPPSCDADPMCNGVSCCAADLVPGGEFTMSDGSSSVTRKVSPFALDRFEVSNSRFQKFILAYDSTPAHKDGEGAHPHVPASGWQVAWNDEYYMSQNGADLAHDLKVCGALNADEPGDYPVRCVTWYMAFAFCIWDRGRLPTEAEWEFAAAAGAERRTYPWSTSSEDSIDPDHACYSQVGDIKSGPEGAAHRPAGAGKFGQLNLAGNVAEWVLDTALQEHAPGPCTARDDPAPDEDFLDCIELTRSRYRVKRGGSFYDLAERLANTYRSNDDARAYREFSGFRCVRDPR